MSFPNKEKREVCWKHRDSYWNCLDEKESKESCKELREEYEKFCPALWVKHFDKKRKYLLFKNQIEKEGYVPEFPKKKMQ